MGHDPFSTRVRRVVTASIETAVSAAENVSGSALLREAVRELERAEEAMRRDRDRLIAKRDGAAADQKSRKLKAAEMAENARYALAKGREDLATEAIAHQMDLEADADRLSTVQAECKVELAQVDEALAELAARREKMRRDVAAVASAEGNYRPAGKPTPQSKVDSAIARANTIFERATGRDADPLHGPTTARGMAEVETMKREDAIAERLAALKAKPEKPAKPKTKR
jgi:phage shock protein A